MKQFLQTLSKFVKNLMDLRHLIVCVCVRAFSCIYCFFAKTPSETPSPPDAAFCAKWQFFRFSLTL